MARSPGVVNIKRYQQRTNPSGPSPGFARAQELPDPFGGMLDGLAEGGAAFSNMIERGEQVDLAIERIEIARDEDDARAYSARAVADATNRYVARAQEVEDAAPDGWQGLTENSNLAWAEIDDEIIAAAPTEISRQFVSQHLGLLRAEMVGRQAGRERDLRRGHRTDTTNAAIRSAGNAIVADPTQYPRLSAVIEQTISTQTDLTADQRRDQLAAAQSELAVYYFEGMIERDPAAALTQLRGRGNQPSADALLPQLQQLIPGATIFGSRTAEENAALPGAAANSRHIGDAAWDITLPEGVTAESVRPQIEQLLGVPITEWIPDDPNASGSGTHLHVAWGEGDAGSAEEGGPASRLTGAQRASLLQQARSGHATANAFLRDTVNMHNQLLARGIMPETPLDPAQVAALGPDVAQTYIANVAGVAAVRGLSDLPLSAVAQVAAGAPQAGVGDMANLLTVEARTAAQSMLQQRTADPGQYGLNHNLLPHQDLLQTMGEAIRTGNWSEAGVALRQRGAAAIGLRDGGVVQRVAVLSTPEAQALTQALSAMPTQSRIQFYSDTARNLNPEAYTSLMGQISQSAPVTAFAGFLWNNPAGRAQNSRDAAQRLLRGQELLNGGGAEGESGRRSPLIDMPPDDDLRDAWGAVVGQAYDHLRGTARPGEADPQENAYQVFRAYYAGLSEAAPSDTINTERAQRAAALATGGVAQWGPSRRETLMPWGMTGREFEQGVRQGFERIGRRGVNPQNYELRARGEGYYQVFNGDVPARNTVGGPLIIQVTRPQ